MCGETRTPRDTYAGKQYKLGEIYASLQHRSEVLNRVVTGIAVRTNGIKSANILLFYRIHSHNDYTHYCTIWSISVHIAIYC